MGERITNDTEQESPAIITGGSFIEGDAEKTETQFEKLCREFREEIEKGNAGCFVSTKVPSEKTFWGYKQQLSSGEGFRNYYFLSHDVRGKGEVTDNLYKDNNKKIGAHGLARKLAIEQMGSSTGKSEDFIRYGNVAISICPLEFKGVPLKTKDYNPKNDKEGILYSLHISYCLDPINLQDKESKRRASDTTHVNFVIKRDLAEQILVEINGTPKKIEYLLNSIDGEIIRVSPIKKESNFKKSGLVIYEKKEGKVVREVLDWNKKTEEPSVSVSESVVDTEPQVKIEQQVLKEPDADQEVLSVEEKNKLKKTGADFASKLIRILSKKDKIISVLGGDVSGELDRIIEYAQDVRKYIIFKQEVMPEKVKEKINEINELLLQMNKFLDSFEIKQAEVRNEQKQIITKNSPPEQRPLEVQEDQPVVASLESPEEIKRRRLVDALNKKLKAQAKSVKTAPTQVQNQSIEPEKKKRFLDTIKENWRLPAFVGAGILGAVGFIKWINGNSEASTPVGLADRPVATADANPAVSVKEKPKEELIRELTEEEARKVAEEPEPEPEPQVVREHELSEVVPAVEVLVEPKAKKEIPPTSAMSEAERRFWEEAAKIDSSKPVAEKPAEANETTEKVREFESWFNKSTAVELPNGDLAVDIGKNAFYKITPQIFYELQNLYNERENLRQDAFERLRRNIFSRSNMGDFNHYYSSNTALELSKIIVRKCKKIDKEDLPNELVEIMQKKEDNSQKQRKAKYDKDREAKLELSKDQILLEKANIIEKEISKNPERFKDNLKQMRSLILELRNQAEEYKTNGFSPAVQESADNFIIVADNAINIIKDYNK